MSVAREHLQLAVRWPRGELELAWVKGEFGGSNLRDRPEF